MNTKMFLRLVGLLLASCLVWAICAEANCPDSQYALPHEPEYACWYKESDRRTSCRQGNKRDWDHWWSFSGSFDNHDYTCYCCGEADECNDTPEEYFRRMKIHDPVRYTALRAFGLQWLSQN